MVSKSRITLRSIRATKLDGPLPVARMKRSVMRENSVTRSGHHQDTRLIYLSTASYYPLHQHTQRSH